MNHPSNAIRAKGMNYFIVAILVVSSMGVVFPAFGEAKEVLEVWDFWSTSEHLALFDSVKEQFEQLHPEVEVRYTTFSGGTKAFGERMITAFATGDGPDVAQASVAFVRDLYNAGLLHPLNDYVDRTPEMHPNQFFPNTQIYNQANGVIFGIPLVLDSNVLFKNVHHLEQAGLDHSPHAIHTWDNFVDYATKLTVEGGSGEVIRSGYSSLLNRNEWNVWLYANGGRIYNDDFSGFDVATEEVAGTLDFLLGLRDRGFIEPPGAGSAFYTDRTAMRITGAHTPLTGLQENPNLEFVATTVPVGPLGSERSVAGWSNMMIITKDAANPDLAWEYISYYAGLEGQQEIARHLGRPGIPRFDFYQTDLWYDMLGSNPWMATLPDIYQSAQPYTALLNPIEAEQIMNEMLTNIRTGGIDPRSAVEEMQRLLTAILN